MAHGCISGVDINEWNMFTIVETFFKPIENRHSGSLDLVIPFAQIVIQRDSVIAVLCQSFNRFIVISSQVPTFGTTTFIIYVFSFNFFQSLIATTKQVAENVTNIPSMKMNGLIGLSKENIIHSSSTNPTISSVIWSQLCDKSEVLSKTKESNSDLWI
jgi:hypothetical protein